MDSRVYHKTLDRRFCRNHSLGDDKQKGQLHAIGLSLSNEKVALWKFRHRELNRVIKAREISLEFSIQEYDPASPEFYQLWKRTLKGLNLS